MRCMPATSPASFHQVVKDSHMHLQSGVEWPKLDHFLFLHDRKEHRKPKIGQPVMIKRPISAKVRAENVAQRFYPNLGYMSQHIARAKSGADGHNGRVWASTLVLHQKMAHASNHRRPKMSCHMHSVHYTTYPWTMLNCSTEAETVGLCSS